MSKKRGRWDSSSDEEEEGKKQESKKVHTSKSSPSFPLHNPLLQGCRSVYDTYERLDRVSEGTFGVVWKAKDLATNQIVALKQIKLDVEQEASLTSYQRTNGFPRAALREINALMALQHECIVFVHEMVVSDTQIFMVMDYYDCDLVTALAKQREALPQSHLKGIFQQILQGLAFVHERGYLHRDLKPANVLVKRETGNIALADFGLARPMGRDLTLTVVTLWYRAPEILFGDVNYGAASDAWSAGCVMAEILDGEGKAIFQGQGELDQIDQMFQLVGSPSETNWPNFKSLPNAGLFRWKESSGSLRQRFPVGRAVGATAHQAFLDNDGFDMLERLLRLDPNQRLSAQGSLDHVYFRNAVKPKRPFFD